MYIEILGSQHFRVRSLHLQEKKKKTADDI